MKKYKIELTEPQLFLIINELYDLRNKEIGLTKQYKKISSLLDKFEKEYFENGDI